VETLTAAQFKKASEKKDLTTISMLSIPNLR
jgi:hypothetical protein